MNEKKWVDPVIGIFIIIFYFISAISKSVVIFQLSKFLNTWLLNFIDILFSVAIIVTIGFLLKPLIISSFEDLKANHKMLFKKYFKFWFLMLGLMMATNLIAYSINGGIAANENYIQESFTKNPIYIYVSAVFIAPFLEELVFRGGVYRIFKNKYAFIIFSGLLFGSLHVLPVMTNLKELFYLIPYSIPGCIFAYLLYDSKNIFVPMGIHFVHNGVLMLLQFIVLLGGK